MHIFLWHQLEWSSASYSRKILDLYLSLERDKKADLTKARWHFPYKLTQFSARGEQKPEGMGKRGIINLGGKQDI